MQLTVASVLFFEMPEDLRSEIGDSQQKHNELVVYLSLAMMSVYLMGTLVVCWTSKSQLRRRRNLVMFGAIYEEIDLNRLSYKLYPFIFFIRRIAIMMLVIMASHEHGLQILF